MGRPSISEAGLVLLSFGAPWAVGDSAARTGLSTIPMTRCRLCLLALSANKLCVWLVVLVLILTAYKEADHAFFFSSFKISKISPLLKTLPMKPLVNSKFLSMIILCWINRKHKVGVRV